jgi:hypothetical protein
LKGEIGAEDQKQQGSGEEISGYGEGKSQKKQGLQKPPSLQQSEEAEEKARASHFAIAERHKEYPQVGAVSIKGDRR